MSLGDATLGQYGVSQGMMLCCGAGLGPPVEDYVAGLRARGLTGARLLTLRCDDLETLGILIIGHQELLLEAVEHLRNFVSSPTLLYTI